MCPQGQGRPRGLHLRFRPPSLETNALPFDQLPGKFDNRKSFSGLTYKYKPGDWYGPSSMAYIMQDAVECGKGKNEALNNLAVYVAQDCAGAFLEVYVMQTQRIFAILVLSDLNSKGCFTAGVNLKKFYNFAAFQKQIA